MSDLIRDLRRYGETLEADVLPAVRRPGIPPDSGTHRAGHAAWWLAAAVVVALALIAGLLVSSNQRDSAPVDIPQVDDAPGVELPLLGFEEQPLDLRHFAPADSYEVLDSGGGPDPSVRISLTVARGGVEDTEGNSSPKDRTRDTVGTPPATVLVGGEEIPVMRETNGFGVDELTVTWSPSEGTVARLAAATNGLQQPEPSAASLDAIRSAAARIVPVSPDEFLGALSSPGPTGDSLSPLVPTELGDTVLIESYPTAAVALDLDLGGRTARLDILGPGSGGGEGVRPYYAERGDAVTVRGVTAFFIAGTEPGLDGTIYDELVWFDGSTLYSLKPTGGGGASEATALAESLRGPTADEWATLLFPSTR